MNQYHTVATPEVKDDLKRYVRYIKDVKKNPQAARSVVDDFQATRKILETMAGVISEPESQRLHRLGLKRINFRRHNYFLLFKIVGDLVIITNMFHGLESFEEKLK